MNANIKWFLAQLIFWLGLWLLDLIGEYDRGAFNYHAVDSLIFFIPLMVLVYLNVLWIIPKYLYKKKYAQYMLYLLVLSTLLAGLQDLDIYLEVGIDQYLISDTFQYIIWAGGISSVWIILEQLRIREQLVTSEKEQSLARIEALKAQINPHFLFNTLNSIHFLIQKDTEKASDILIRLSGLMRYQLYETEEQFVNLKNEVEHIKNYLALEKMKMGDRLELNASFDYEGGAPKISPFMLLPLVENAFKHSVNRGVSKIKIELKLVENRLTLDISNSLPDKKNTEKGLGIANLIQRLDLLYHNEYYLEHGVMEGMYKTQLILTL